MEGTFRSAYASAQAAVAGAEAILAGEKAAFALCRPPGHHAYADRCSEFCFPNNAAIAAEVLRRHFPRVAVPDFDTHHGDGTQAIFYGRADVLYGSVTPTPPPTIRISQATPTKSALGQGRVQTSICRCPGTRRRRLHRRQSAASRGGATHGTEALVLSAGWDAHRDDPLSKLAVTTHAFARIGEL